MYVAGRAVSTQCIAFLRSMLVALVLVAGLGGCGGDVRPSIESTYVVKPGDTLYSISWRHGLDYHDVARWNHLPADYRIKAGLELTLVPTGQDATNRAVAGAHSTAAPAATRTKPTSGARETHDAPLPTLPVTPAPRWVWPVDGTVLGTVQQLNGGVGLEIDGAVGTEVRAAAAGRVVYTGAGLRGYGQLIIVKHDEAWLTAYGYNSAVFVAEGELVKANQRIAAVGEGPGRRARLYFEIRLNGRPVDPITQLPRRSAP